MSKSVKRVRAALEAAGIAPEIKEMADGHAVRRAPDLLTVVSAIEASRVPVVAAIGGVALGGGCEVSEAVAAFPADAFHSSLLLALETLLGGTPPKLLWR